VFKQIDYDFLQVAQQQQLADGTTCLMALILNCKLTIANLGDSSAILIRNNQMLELSSEQVPTRIDEYQRIIEKKGCVIPVGPIMRVQGVLAVTRAIGDLAYKEFITSEPELGSIQISPQDQYLILSTDGLYKSFSKEYVAQRVVAMHKEGQSFG
jgi:serine/threonine protein phosphatase PrpC